MRSEALWYMEEPQEVANDLKVMKDELKDLVNVQEDVEERAMFLLNQFMELRKDLADIIQDGQKNDTHTEEIQQIYFPARITAYILIELLLAILYNKHKLDSLTVVFQIDLLNLKDNTILDNQVKKLIQSFKE